MEFGGEAEEIKVKKELVVYLAWLRDTGAKSGSRDGKQLHGERTQMVRKLYRDEAFERRDGVRAQQGCFWGHRGQVWAL